MAIWQTERDICYMYRHSRKPSEQIKIMAELNGCSVEKIKDVLKRNGITPAKPEKANRRKIRAENWKVEDLVQLLYLVESGMSIRKLAEYFDRSEAAIGSIRSKINTRQTETARVALEIFNRERRGNSA